MESGESPDIHPPHRYVTPVELGQTRFKRSVRGYDAEEVDALLAKLRESYLELYKERLALAVEVRTLQDEINRLDADQNLIHQVLVEARRSAEELRAEGARDGDLIRADARQEAAEIVREAQQEAEQLNDELERLRDLDRDMRAGYRAFLLAALELVEGGGPARAGETVQPAEAEGSSQPVAPGDARDTAGAGDGDDSASVGSLETARTGS